MSEFRRGCYASYGYWPSDAELVEVAEANERERRVERERVKREAELVDTQEDALVKEDE